MLAICTIRFKYDDDIGSKSFISKSSSQLTNKVQCPRSWNIINSKYDDNIGSFHFQKQLATYKQGPGSRESEHQLTAIPSYIF